MLRFVHPDVNTAKRKSKLFEPSRSSQLCSHEGPERCPPEAFKVFCEEGLRVWGVRAVGFEV